MAGWNKIPLGMEVGIGLGDFVFDGDPATTEKKAHTPHPILAHVYCGQTAGWMNTPLGTEVDLGPVHIVLDQVPACLLYTSPSPRDRQKYRMPSSA